VTPLVDGDWLEAHLDDPDLVILEVSFYEPARASYFQGHAPGAHYVPWKEFCWHDTNREFADPDVMANRLAAYGATDASTVVLIGDTIQFATYAYWTITMAGLEHLVTVLDGGSLAWLADERPSTTDLPPPPVPGSVTVGKADQSSLVGRDDVLAHLDDPGRVLIDVRSPEEYLGERVSPLTSPFDYGAERKGRIPGAKHLYYLDRLLNENGTFRSPEETIAEFEKEGAGAGDDIVTYCRLSHRASLAWFAMTRLANQPNVRIYDGSWTEWGSIVGYPVEI
jgi:thiosulfate/3-mercaptopyruvate sulfurtransferase